MRAARALLVCTAATVAALLLALVPVIREVRVFAAQSAAVPGPGNPVRGKALFEKQCTGCHALTKNKEGPQLQGVFGRTSGTAAGFVYSDALKKAGIVWDETSLDKWLTDPDAFIGGNEMDFSVSDPQERMDLISYLRLSSGK